MDLLRISLLLACSFTLAALALFVASVLHLRTMLQYLRRRFPNVRRKLGGGSFLPISPVLLLRFLLRGKYAELNDPQLSRYAWRGCMLALTSLLSLIAAGIAGIALYAQLIPY